MFKLRRKVTQYDFVIVKYKLYQFSGGGDQRRRFNLGRCLSQDPNCEEAKMHGPGEQMEF